MRIFIDISSDKIWICGLEKPIFLDRNGVEVEIGNILVELDKRYDITECIVLNGPGGFTNLRVGTLALNLLKTLKSNQIKLYNLSKPELYSIFYKNWWIPRYWIMYIGQKSNVWVWDTKEKKLIKMVKKSEIDDIKNEYWEIYLDQVYDNWYFWDLKGKLCYNYNDWIIHLNFNWEHIVEWSEITKNMVEKLEANYMIDPNVS